MSGKVAQAGLALVVVVGLIGGCGRGRSPESLVRAFATASAAGNRAQVWALLGPRTRARLEAHARRARELSSRRTFGPEELLAVGWGAPRFHPLRVRLVDQVGAMATVEVRGPGGERDDVSLVREGKQWKVELP